MRVSVTPNFGAVLGEREHVLSDTREPRIISQMLRQAQYLLPRSCGGQLVRAFTRLWTTPTSSDGPGDAHPIVRPRLLAQSPSPGIFGRETEFVISPTERFVGIQHKPPQLARMFRLNVAHEQQRDIPMGGRWNHELNRR